MRNCGSGEALGEVLSDWTTHEAATRVKIASTSHEQTKSRTKAMSFDPNDLESELESLDGVTICDENEYIDTG